MGRHRRGDSKEWNDDPSLVDIMRGRKERKEIIKSAKSHKPRKRSAVVDGRISPSVKEQMKSSRRLSETHRSDLESDGEDVGKGQKGHITFHRQSRSCRRLSAGGSSTDKIKLSGFDLAPVMCNKHTSTGDDSTSTDGSQDQLPTYNQQMRSSRRLSSGAPPPEAAMADIAAKEKKGRKGSAKGGVSGDKRSDKKGKGEAVTSGTDQATTSGNDTDCSKRSAKRKSLINDQNVETDLMPSEEQSKVTRATDQNQTVSEGEAHVPKVERVSENVKGKGEYVEKKSPDVEENSANVEGLDPDVEENSLMIAEADIEKTAKAIVEKSTKAARKGIMKSAGLPTSGSDQEGNGSGMTSSDGEKCDRGVLPPSSPGRKSLDSSNRQGKAGSKKSAKAGGASFDTSDDSSTEPRHGPATRAAMKKAMCSKSAQTIGLTDDEEASESCAQEEEEEHVPDTSSDSGTTNVVAGIAVISALVITSGLVIHFGLKRK